MPVTTAPLSSCVLMHRVQHFTGLPLLQMGEQVTYKAPHSVSSALTLPSSPCVKWF